MTWKLGGYWGAEVAIRDTCYHFVKLHLRIATSSPHVLLNSVVIPSASEGSLSLITVLSKTELQRTFFKFHIIFDLCSVVISSEAMDLLI